MITWILIWKSVLLKQHMYAAMDINSITLNGDLESEMTTDPKDSISNYDSYKYPPMSFSIDTDHHYSHL